MRRIVILIVATCRICCADSGPSPLFIDPAEYLSPAPKVATAAATARNIAGDQKDIWSSPLHINRMDLRWIVPLAAVTGLLIGTDQHTSALVHTDPANRRLSSDISNAGLATFAGTSAAAFALGSIVRNEHARETGLLASEAMADSFLFSEALQVATDRARPQTTAGGQFWSGSPLDGSFPSNHAALAWSAAAVIAREYPGPVTQWAAYGLASLISVSRVTASAHFPADVLVGAAAGYLIGRHVYDKHHDDRLTDITGATPVEEPANGFVRQNRPAGAPTGPIYVPLDSWIYPALERLGAMGLIPDQTSDAAPWTREECLRQTLEAEEIASSINEGSSDPEAYRLIADLKRELGENAANNWVRLESLYTRITEIAGAPLRDSYHFGQTITNDFGRPYGEGINNITGASAYGEAGRFSFYIRGEYQNAPGAPAYSLPVRQFISAADGTSLQPGTPIATQNNFTAVEMYAGVRWGPENITFGKQSLWWSPGEESAFSFSNNAAPFYMLRLSQANPLVLPGPFAALGKIHTEIVLGKLAGHHYPARPYMNAEKITLDVTRDLEIGFTRSAFFGGVGHPLTLGSFEASLFSMNSVDYGPYGSADLPGDRHSGFDFRWRVPGLRRYVTIYSDSYADDEPNPIDAPRRSAWAPGIYFPRLPGVRHVDLRFETWSTLLYAKDQGGNFLYWDNQYRDSYTNDGNLLGSWIGRDSRAYAAKSRYWVSGRSRVDLEYRQIKAGTSFLPGGGTQTDVSIAPQWSLGPEWMVGTQVQYERYFVPVLGGARRDWLGSLQVTYTPLKSGFGF